MSKTVLLLLAAAVLAALGRAQPKGPPAPPLMSCGAHGAIEILCGTRSPEDLELTPDGKYLIVPQFVNVRPGASTPPGEGLTLFDLAAKSYSKISVSAEQRKDWGDPACPGPIGDALVPHGISLLKRSGGAIQLFVVNHGGRQSIEMFELKPAGGSWSLVWHGCVVTMQEFNDVAALPDGGFIATHPTALRVPGDTSDLFAGKPSGWVARWSATKGEEELPGTRAGYPNGVLVSADGRFMYFNAWTAKEVHKYDLKQAKETGMVKLDFMPDNITWTGNRQMLAAGVKGARGECPPNSGTPCGQTFGVAEIDPAKMTGKTVFDSEGKGALISGVSVALQVGNDMYIGAFQGDRLVKTGFKK
ncbi:MAG TPA: SMP-30/gluconolactonase/LRE family protein [Bryobacteraceae bacterium]|nr:SMP-30/gluconolactonase/LRE family protein [Bryobacteraceae bacterium]